MSGLDSGTRGTANNDCSNAWAGVVVHNIVVPRRLVSLVLLVGVLILTGCVRAKSTPLGSTKDGRRQFQMTCNGRATDNGACNDKAREACGGDYETMSIGNTGAEAVTIGNQVSSVPGDSVWLIACHNGT